jgi:hypothetical protein
MENSMLLLLQGVSRASELLCSKVALASLSKLQSE